MLKNLEHYFKKAQKEKWAIGQFNFSDLPQLEGIIEAAKESGDTIGGVIQVVAAGMTPGLGSMAMPDERLDARLSYALMGVPWV